MNRKRTQQTKAAVIGLAVIGLGIPLILTMAEYKDQWLQPALDVYHGYVPAPIADFIASVWPWLLTAALVIVIAASLRSLRRQAYARYGVGASVCLLLGGTYVNSLIKWLQELPAALQSKVSLAILRPNPNLRAGEVKTKHLPKLGVTECQVRHGETLKGTMTIHERAVRTYGPILTKAAHNSKFVIQVAPLAGTTGSSMTSMLGGRLKNSSVFALMPGVAPPEILAGLTSSDLFERAREWRRTHQSSKKPWTNGEPELVEVAA